MRKCKFSIYERDFKKWSDLQDGLFHQFGTELEEDDRGFHENTVCIVEDMGGLLHKVSTHKIEFLDKL